MKISVAEIRDNLADTLNRAVYHGERIVIERRGKSVAAIVSMTDLELLEAMDDQEDARAAKRALTEMKQKGQKPVPLRAVRKRLGMD